MASFTKHVSKNGITTFRVQLFVNGIRDSKGGFRSKAEARIWAAQREAEMLQGGTQSNLPATPASQAKTTAPERPVSISVPADHSAPNIDLTPSKTLADVFDRYSAEVSPTKIGCRWEKIRLFKLSCSPLASTPLKDLGPEHIAAWRDSRLKQVSGATVRREMTLISSALETARREWRWISTNPSRECRKPPDSKHRTQRITSKDLHALVGAMNYVPGTKPSTLGHETAIALLLAIETAMRAGEILGLTLEHIHLDQSYVHLPTTKNGSSRNVPLSTDAKKLIQLMLDLPPNPDGRLFRLQAATRDTFFRKAKVKVGLDHIHFHDSRREATSRLSEIFSPLELSKITGHKRLDMLLVYYEKSATDLANKMNQSNPTDEEK